MSRTNDRRFLFSKGRVKGEIVSLLRRAAAFSGVRLEAWCVMDDHFHIVCEVFQPDAPVPEAEVVRRISILKGERFAAELAEHWADLRSCGMDSVADAALDGWRARMHDVSQFAKTFKGFRRVCPRWRRMRRTDGGRRDEALFRRFVGSGVRFQGG